MTNSLRSGYQGTTHSDVDTSSLVWKIADKSNELELQSIVPERDTNATVRPVTDIFSVGFDKFHTTSLAAFNKKLADVRQGDSIQPEVDEIAPCQMDVGVDADDVDPMGDKSAVHED